MTTERDTVFYYCPEYAIITIMDIRTNRIYLDYAASTPVDGMVFAAMKPYFSEKFGNPGSLHSFGQEAIAAVDASREAMAKAINAEFRDIIFTGSATEANNLALRGAVKKYMSAERKTGNNAPPRLIVSAMEHESILETARELEKENIEVVFLPASKNGAVDIRTLGKSLNDSTVLVSVMYANNEIGAIQHIEEISGIVRNFRGSSLFPLLHTDAAQAFQFLDCDVKKSGVDMMTLSAHKIYGPKGIGALYLSSPLAASITGGGQEFGMRSGTENVASIVGFSEAAAIISRSRERENVKIAALRDYFWHGIKDIYPKAELNGQASPSRRMNTLPNILNVYFPARAAQDILTRLDLSGIAASSGSACRARALEPSYVIAALGYSKERAKASIRFSLGRPTTRNEIKRTLAVLRRIL